VKIEEKAMVALGKKGTNKYPNGTQSTRRISAAGIWNRTPGSIHFWPSLL